MKDVFFLPFAGGSSYSYREFYDAGKKINLNIIPIELPGRGLRVSEKGLTDIHEMAEDVYRQVDDRLHDSYAIYGHSMGALIGFLLTKCILRKGLKPPCHLFLSGSDGPAVRNEPEHSRHLLPREELIEVLRKMGGSSEVILQDRKLMDFFEPIIRDDLQAVDTYRYEAEKPFSIPITAMLGTEENLLVENVSLWQNETIAKTDVITLPGDHFFILTPRNQKKILEIINQKMSLI